MYQIAPVKYVLIYRRQFAVMSNLGDEHDKVIDYLS